jgi:hypothetical protein
MDAVVGVVIGWLLSSLGQAAGWFWRRHEQRTSQRQQVRRNARLVLAAFGDAAFELERIASGEIGWGEVGFATFGLDELIGSLNAAEWNAVADAYREVQA